MGITEDFLKSMNKKKKSGLSVENIGGAKTSDFSNEYTKDFTVKGSNDLTSGFLKGMNSQENIAPVTAPIRNYANLAPVQTEGTEADDDTRKALEEEYNFRYVRQQYLYGYLFGNRSLEDMPEHDSKFASVSKYALQDLTTDQLKELYEQYASATREAYENLQKYDRGEWEKTSDSNSDGYFKGSYEFSDGYDFGDISRVILGTTGDALTHALGGFLEMGENALDGVVYIGQLLSAGLITEEQAKRFIERDLYSGHGIADKYLGTLFDWGVGGNAEDSSILGDKSDALAESGGQLLGAAALQAVNVPWWLTTGATSFGSELENAFSQGATYGEAGGSALISAGAEILTEKMFGSSGLGEKGWIDLDKFTRGISSKVLKTLADFGIDMAAEGSEEFVSQVFSNLGSKLYREEDLGEILFSERAWQEYLDSFIGGMALGGMMNVGKATNSAVNGTDYRSKLTKNEQAVVEKIYKEELAEAEKNGKVSSKGKTEIWNSVIERMTRGDISTDIIEGVLGGETYKSYKGFEDNKNSLLEQFKTISNQYNELNQKPLGNLTGAESDLRDSLKSQIADFDTKIKNSQQNPYKDQLSYEVSKLVSGDRLSESYNQQAQRGQYYTADLSKYDYKQQAIVKKAMDSGVLNNTRATHEFVDFVAKVCAEKGIDFDFVNNAKLKESGFAIDGKTVNGYYSNGTIGINIDSAKAWQSTVGHEITHVLEGTDMYNALQSSLFEYAKSKGEYDTRLADLTELYKNVKDADVAKELTADLVGDYLFTDKDFINNLSAKNRNLFKKIYDEIKYLCKVATAGSKQARELEKVKKAFEEAYRAGNNKGESVQHSLSDSSGKQLTTEQQEFFKDSKMRDDAGNLMVMYHGSQDAGFHVFDPKMSDDDTSFFFVDRNDVAASYSGTSETYEARTIRTAEDMNNFLAEIGYEHYEAVERNGKFELLEDGDHVAWSDTAQGIYDEFCWCEGVGEGDANYKVYLNLTNPMVIDAKGRPWNKIDAEFSQEVYDRFQSLTAEERDALRDLAEWEDFRIFNSEIQEARGNALETAYKKLDDVNIYDIFSVASDNFSEESLRENSRYYLKTRDYAQRAKEQGYDGVIFNNIVDNGGYSNGSEGASTVAIAFNSNQIKSVANANPTADADIRFSLSEPVEQTKDLMALHNLTEQKLLKSLKLGGLPMPSVAIAKAQDGHSDFGEISLVLPREAIDPKSSRNNKLYSGDAWTPTYPSVAYKVDEKALRNISKKLYNLVPSDVLHNLGRISLDADNMADTLNRWGGDVVTAFGNNEALKYAYLLDNGADITLPMKEKRISYGSNENGEIIRIAEAIPADEIKQALNGASTEMRKLEPRVRQAVTEYWQDTYGDDPAALELLIPKEELSFSDLDGYLSDAMRYHRNGVERTVDSRAAKTAIADQTIQTEYEKWLEQTFSGIVEKEGIRNNKDYFTPSGNRRSFEALHYEHNLENVIKAMREKGEKGIGGFGGGSIFGAATTEFSSIEDMKQASDRLQKMSDEEYQKMRDEFSNRFFEIAGKLPKDKNSFMATDDAANTLVEAVAKYNTRNGIANYLRRELNGWATYSDQAVDDLIELVRDVRNMPAGYFEAKPQRAVGFDEVAVFVIPRNADVKLKQELLNRGYSIAEYDPDVEGDRQKVVNQFEEYKFSLSNVGDQTNYGNYSTPANKMRLEGISPVAENVVEDTKAAESVPVVETVAPEDMFPDDLSPIETELDRLTQEYNALEAEMYEMAMAEDIGEAFMQKHDRWSKLGEEIELLEAEVAEADSARLESIDDTDAPTVVERHYNSQADTTPIEEADIAAIAKEAGGSLSLNSKQKGDFRKLIEEYIQSDKPSREQLFWDIKSEFGTYKERSFEETISNAKKYLRTTKLYVSDTIIGDIADFAHFKKRNRGKVTMSANGGLPVDSAYQELSGLYPHLFPIQLISFCRLLMLPI